MKPVLRHERIQRLAKLGKCALADYEKLLFRSQESMKRFTNWGIEQGVLVECEKNVYRISDMVRL